MMKRVLILFALVIFISSCAKEEKYKCGGEILHIKDNTIEVTARAYVSFDEHDVLSWKDGKEYTLIYKITEKSDKKFIAMHKFEFDLEGHYQQIVFHKKTGEYEHISMAPYIRKEPIVNNHKCVKY